MRGYVVWTKSSCQLKRNHLGYAWSLCIQDFSNRNMVKHRITKWTRIKQMKFQPKLVVNFCMVENHCMKVNPHPQIAYVEAQCQNIDKGNIGILRATS